MSKISKSPERHTFQKEGHIKRAKKEGKEPNKDYLKMWENFRIEDEKREASEEWKINNMEHDLRSTKWICDKVKGSDVYAQNLYAAMCNMRFFKVPDHPQVTWDLLQDKMWSCSWRSSGGIVANMREQGDYIDWYCSGIQNFATDEADPNFNGGGYVPEGVVTDEIREDLAKLGWTPSEWPDNG
jgi:hypothetical protein